AGSGTPLPGGKTECGVALDRDRERAPFLPSFWTPTDCLALREHRLASCGERGTVCCAYRLGGAQRLRHHGLSWSCMRQRRPLELCPHFAIRDTVSACLQGTSPHGSANDPVFQLVASPTGTVCC